MNEKQGGGLVEGGISMISTVFKWVAVVKYCLYVYYYLNIVNGLLEEEDDGSSDWKKLTEEERRTTKL